MFVTNNFIPKTIKYPCGVCFKNCASSCIFCDKCESWMHYKFEKSSNKDFSTLSMFRYCNLNAVYDSKAALKRLQKSSQSIGCAYERGNGEKILMRMQMLSDRIKDINAPDHWLHTLDKYIIPSKAVATVRRDGNCLFNAISFAMFASESFSKQILVIKAIIMPKNC